MSLDSPFIIISRVLLLSLRKIFVELSILIRWKHLGVSFQNVHCVLLVSKTKIVDLTLTSKIYFILPLATLWSGLWTLKAKVTATYQKNFLEATEKLSNNFPHLWHQFEYPQRSKAPKHHEELSSRFRRHILRHPTKKYQAHLEGK